jgi:hypothetical protein
MPVKRVLVESGRQIIDKNALCALCTYGMHTKKVDSE